MIHAAIALMLAACSAASAHDIYAGVKLWRPGMDKPVDCCGGRDCAPYPYRTNPSETAYEALINGRWLALPPDKVLGDYSPDGQVHVCCPTICTSPAAIRCVWLPGRGV